MGPYKQAAMLGAILVALLVFAILIGVILGTSGMITGSGGGEVLPADGRGMPEGLATTGR
jgi:hypothetical protein